MSQNLYWRPVVPITGHSLPDALKFKLRDKLDLANGSSTLGRNMIGYLAGLQDCGIEGAKELIDAIQKHDQVEVFLQ